MNASTVKPSPRIPIHTCEGLFEKLKWDHQQLEEGWNEYRTFNFVITAYHLYNDWIDNAGTREQRQRKNNLPQLAKTLFLAIRDITNASKHWKLDKPSQAKQKVSDVSAPTIGDWYAYLVAGPVMYVTVDDAHLSLPELASISMQCFEWILSGPTNICPTDLENKLTTVFSRH